MASIPVAEATKKQLRHYAKEIMQLDGVTNFMNEEQLLTKIREGGFEGDVLEFPDDANDPPATTTPKEPDEAEEPKQATATRERRYITIQIAETDNDARPVPVSVNGVAMLIERGVPSRVPEEYVEALKNATRTKYDVDPKTKRLFNPRQVPTVQFTVISEG